MAVQFTNPPHPSDAVPAHWLAGQGLGLGVQLVHTLLTQVLGNRHLPHASVPPQPSGSGSQFLPCAAQVVGVQPHTFTVPPPPQDCGLVQLPQLMLPPQPLEMVPQFLPCAAQVVGVQPHTFAVPPPPQDCGLVQLPQLMLPPQPLEIVPQFLP